MIISLSFHFDIKIKMSSATTLQHILDAVQIFDPNVTPKTKQIECLQTILCHKDVIVNLTVGYGKSRIYQCLPMLLSSVSSSTNVVVLVVSPLTIIQQDQMQILAEHNIKAFRLPFGDESVVSKDDQQKLCKGEYSIVMCHPESLLNNTWGKALLRNEDFTSKVHAVVIDECHIVEDWYVVFFNLKFVQLYLIVIHL